jgi:AcrR family transcriptional regulator
MAPKVLPGYKEMVRSRIVETARQVALESGFRQATMEEIAERIGISKAAIYKYFDDKEELFRAVYAASSRNLEETIKSVVREGGDVRQVLDSLFDEMMPAENGNIALDLEVASEAARSVEIRKVLKKANDQYLDAVRRHIVTSGGREKGDSWNLAGAILALWNGLELLLAVGYSRDEVRDFWRVSMDRLVAPGQSRTVAKQG